MKILTAIGNEEINKKIGNFNEVRYPDIQYQEAVIDILEKNKKIDILILNSILPGELSIYELINIIKYKNPELKIIIILEKENNKLINFLIAKDIEDIFYNNKTTYKEILEKIEYYEKNRLINNNYKENTQKNNKNILRKIKNIKKIIIKNIIAIKIINNIKKKIKIIKKIINNKKIIKKRKIIKNNNFKFNSNKIIIELNNKKIKIIIK